MKLKIDIVEVKTQNYCNELVYSYWTLDWTVWLWMYCNRLAHDQYVCIYTCLYIYIYIYIYIYTSSLYLCSACNWLNPFTCLQINIWRLHQNTLLLKFHSTFFIASYQLRESSKTLIHVNDLSFKYSWLIVFIATEPIVNLFLNNFVVYNCWQVKCIFCLIHNSWSQFGWTKTVNNATLICIEWSLLVERLGRLLCVLFW